MTSNQGTESTAGHYAQDKLKQKVTYNLYMIIDLPQEDKHSMAKNLSNVWSQGADSFTQREIPRFHLYKQITAEKHKIFYFPTHYNPAGSETWGHKELNRTIKSEQASPSAFVCNTSDPWTFS